MKKTVFAFLVSVLLLPAIASAELKIAIIDSGYVMSKTPEIDAIGQKLKKEFDGRKSQLQREFDKLEQDRTDYVNNVKTMSASQRTEKERDMKQRASDLKLKKDAYEEDFKRRSQEERQGLGGKLRTAVDAVAKRGGYDILIERQAAPYVGTNVPNVTEQVLAELSK